MKFVLTSKTESEYQPGKAQLHFRLVDPNAPANEAGGMAPTGGSYINFNGFFDKTEADEFEVGATYEMELTKVVSE